MEAPAECFPVKIRRTFRKVPSLVKAADAARKRAASALSASAPSDSLIAVFVMAVGGAVFASVLAAVLRSVLLPLPVAVLALILAVLAAVLTVLAVIIL